MQLDNLGLRFGTIEKDALKTDSAKKKYDEIAAYFDRRRAVKDMPAKWDDAYRLETQIGCLLSGDRLRREIAGRLRWATADNVPQAAVLQNSYVALLESINNPPNPPNPPIPPKQDNADELLRDFLLEVMEAIHWHSRWRFISRKARGQATRRTLLIGLVALLVALWPYFMLPSTLQTNAATSFESGNFWAHFALYTSITFGFLGALFSRLINLQRQWRVMAIDELFSARSYHYIVLRASIGILGALVVYFFLQSGLVTGSVFPAFKDLTMHAQSYSEATPSKWPSRLVLPSVNLALLIMWSFIAGFSESLVPTVLSNTERQFAGATTSAGK